MASATQTSAASTSEHAVGQIVWVNGTLYTDPNQAKVSAVDHGIVVGDGVFEAMKVVKEGVFATTRHLARLARSAKAMGLPEPDLKFIRAGIDEVIGARDWEVGKVRVTYTGGEGPLGSGEAYGPSLAMVAAEAVLEPPGPTTKIVTTPWTRNTSGAMTGVKTTSYAENVRGLAYAHHRGGTEAIFVNSEGNMCEGTGSNIFFVFGDRIITPPLSAGPLAGITRGLLLEWDDNIDEEDILPDKAKSADEVFITSSLRDVQGVAVWDDRTWDAPGPRTRQVMDIFLERSTADLDPA